MDIQQQTAEEKVLFQRLRESYIKSIPAKLAELTTAWDQAQKQNWQADQATVLKRHIHKLAGSGSSYGLPQITQAARKLEKSLDLELMKVNPLKQLRTTASVDNFISLQAVLVALIDDQKSKTSESRNP